MTPIDYATKEAFTRNPGLGRLAAVCAGAGFIGLVGFRPLSIGASNIVPAAIVFFLSFLAFGVGSILSGVAVAQRRSRTRTAWIALSLCCFMCLCSYRFITDPNFNSQVSRSLLPAPKPGDFDGP